MRHACESCGININCADVRSICDEPFAPHKYESSTGAQVLYLHSVKCAPVDVDTIE